MKSQPASQRPRDAYVELLGDVGDRVVRIEPGQTIHVHRAGYTPFAITGLTVTPWPSDENSGALISLDHGAAVPILQVTIFQLQRRRVWPTLLFFDRAAVCISAPGLRSPIELRFLWEAILP